MTFGERLAGFWELVVETLEKIPARAGLGEAPRLAAGVREQLGHAHSFSLLHPEERDDAVRARAARLRSS